MFIFSFHFLYGFRTIALIVIGISSISTAKFVILNLLSAVVWSVIIAFLGYDFGQVFEIILEDVKKYEAIIIVAGIAIFLIRMIFYVAANRKNE